MMMMVIEYGRKTRQPQSESHLSQSFFTSHLLIYHGVIEPQLGWVLQKWWSNTRAVSNLIPFQFTIWVIHHFWLFTQELIQNLGQKNRFVIFNSQFLILEEVKKNRDSHFLILGNWHSPIQHLWFRIQYWEKHFLRQNSVESNWGSNTLCFPSTMINSLRLHLIR